MIPIWSNTNGQDDIIWYEATKSGSNYVCNVSLKSHKSLGAYSIHAYAYNAANNMQFLTSTKFTTKTPGATTVSASSVNASSGTFKLTVSGVTNTAALSEVKIPVWCASNQSDIVWYTAIKQSNGTYAITVNTKNHKYNEGTYQAHVYMIDITRTLSYKTKTSVILKSSVGSITAVDTTKKETNFRISANSLVPAAGTNSVHVAVWSTAGGQDDIKWYTMTKSGNNYICNVPISNHKTLGKYNAHVYIQKTTGTMQYVGATTFNVTLASAIK